LRSSSADFRRLWAEHQVADGTASPAVDVLSRAVAELLAAGVEQGAVRDDVGPGAVLMALQGICSVCGEPGSRADADGVVTLVLDGLRRRPA
ncbi:hypothetical protein AB0C31_44330, partial [Actinoplanes philippinensis]